MKEQKYYYIKYRECRHGDEKWEHYSVRTDTHPFLEECANSSYDYARIIDFFTEITEEEYNYRIE